jgi:hypothetical protein
MNEPIERVMIHKTANKVSLKMYLITKKSS